MRTAAAVIWLLLAAAFTTLAVLRGDADNITNSLVCIAIATVWSAR